MAVPSTPDSKRSPRSEEKSEELSATAAARSALEQLASLTGLPMVGVTAVAPNEDGWTVEVEVVEARRVPSTSDILASYEAKLDGGGDLLSYRRTRRYVRGRADSGNGAGR